LPVVVRSWNLFHGNSAPPSRHGRLRAMIELATRDRPGVLCLQEVPPWSLGALEEWSGGMRAHTIVVRTPRHPAALAAWVTRLNQGLFRSRLAGQAQAILVDPALPSEWLGGTQVSEPGRERRVVQAVRVDGVGVIGNLHATNAIATSSIPALELTRAAAFLERLARPGEGRVLAGDLNHHHAALEGYVNGGAGIDHILVAGLPATPLVAWPRERREQDGVLLSDHAPVERTVGDAAVRGANIGASIGPLLSRYRSRPPETH
jgi:endonuclease/exonuclease/phosphatase family metal-dependent hydrolase